MICFWTLHQKIMPLLFTWLLPNWWLSQSMWDANSYSYPPGLCFLNGCGTWNDRPKLNVLSSFYKKICICFLEHHCIYWLSCTPKHTSFETLSCWAHSLINKNMKIRSLMNYIKFVQVGTVVVSYSCVLCNQFQMVYLAWAFSILPYVAKSHSSTLWQSGPLSTAVCGAEWKDFIFIQRYGLLANFVWVLLTRLACKGLVFIFFRAVAS